MFCSGINNLIDAGEGEGIVGAGLVEVFEIDAQVPGPILLWYHDQIGEPVGVFDLSYESNLEEFG